MLKLSQIPEVIEVPSFSDEAKLFLQNLVLNFTPDDALEVKKIEKVTNHDVKAVEYFLKEKCKLHAEVGKVSMMVFFLCIPKDDALNFLFDNMYLICELLKLCAHNLTFSALYVFVIPPWNFCNDAQVKCSVSVTEPQFIF